MGTKRKERDKVKKAANEKSWWKFSRNAKINPKRELNIEHNVNFDQPNEGPLEYPKKNDNHDNTFYR